MPVIWHVIESGTSQPGPGFGALHTPPDATKRPHRP